MFEKTLQGKAIAIRLSYSLKDARIEYERFKSLLEAEGFGAYIPRRRTPGELFSAVTNRLAGTCQQGEYRFKTIVIETHDSEKTVERVVLAAALDRKNRKITDGDKVARLLFDKDTGEIVSIFADINSVWGFEGMERDLKPCPAFIREAIGGLREAMDEEKKLVSPSQVRGAFLRIVSSIGIPVDGILATWNLPVTAAGTAQSLRGIAKAINEEAGQRVMRFDAIEIYDGSDLLEDIRGDALVFATKELERLLLIEQEKIEVDPDPNAADRAASRFSKDAGKLMALIGRHQDSLGEEVEKVNCLRQKFEDLIRDFEIPVEGALIA